MQHVALFVILLVDVCAALEELVEDVPVILPCGGHERCAAALVVHVDVAAIAEEDVDDANVVLFDRAEERRNAVAGGAVSFCTVFQEVSEGCQLRAVKPLRKTYSAM